jgi:hypothetical protein
MKNRSILKPDVIPFGLTRVDARARAIVRASFVNRPRGGAVETVVTERTQRRVPPPAFLAGFLTGQQRRSVAWRRG